MKKNPNTNEWRTLAESYIAKMTDEEMREYAIKSMERDIMIVIKAIKILWGGAKNGKEEQHPEHPVQRCNDQNDRIPGRGDLHSKI